MTAWTHIAIACASILAAQSMGACASAPDGPDPRAGSAELAPSIDTERADWGPFFDAEGGRGTFVLLDAQTGKSSRFNTTRAQTRFIAASTFKVYNSLVALETGAVRNPDSLFVWDGQQRSIPQWNRDNSLRTGMEFSVVWLYQRLAESIGTDAYSSAFAREPYGNGSTGTDVTLFWLDNSLRISADEQVAFLDNLRRGDLAFRPEVQATVRDIMPVQASSPEGRVLAKTGWGFYPDDPTAPISYPTEDGNPIGWLVGWVQRAGGRAYVFALNVEPAADDFDMRSARLKIAQSILESESLWPE